MEEKFALVNSNREEALKATHSVIKRLLIVGKLQVFKSQIDEMEKMGSIIALTEDKVKDLATGPHHFNKLGFTISSTSSSTPLWVKKRLHIQGAQGRWNL